MMKYSSELNTQFLVALLKEHGIKKIIASPGATNVSFVASVQSDPFFKVYSSVDERSAAYMACGLAAESGEPVVLSCTGATASRNYLPGLTEAYYRNLPVIAVTATLPLSSIGHLKPQVIDRTVQMNDVVKMSVQVPHVQNKEDEWATMISLNRALLEARRHDGGPVHINLVTKYGGTFDVAELPPVRKIDRIERNDVFPSLSGKIGIFIGSHKVMKPQLERAIDLFCEKYNAVVLCDHTSNYQGKYGVMAALVTSQKDYRAKCCELDVLIHIGDISGAYLQLFPKEVWRVNPDGEIRDTFGKLRYVFEMYEEEFFAVFNGKDVAACDTSFYAEWINEYSSLYQKIGDLPFSNIWVAQQLCQRLPKKSVLHFGILNSLRSWNFFSKTDGVQGYSNTGGFGIDGCVSSLIGASLFSDETLYFGIVGDLAFFYDMNALGNRHVGNNVRLIVVNNGHGQEFTNYGHRAAQFGEETEVYIAASGHYGSKSKTLIKNYATDLGFRYMCADAKEDFLENLSEFLRVDDRTAPILFEIFTDKTNESDALNHMVTLETSMDLSIKGSIRRIIGDDNVRKMKRILKGTNE